MTCPDDECELLKEDPRSSKSKACAPPPGPTLGASVGAEAAPLERTVGKQCPQVTAAASGNAGIVSGT